ncbi:uncharacterized protein LOC127242755 isoform X2 [Andrographis paniculata]|uniref:uncharacterized protein LOC127242755 isoform X2 n=1 Tax=Andrographis paniculata TaxID=175694 RepID=UPI0021E6E47F|nr:uncharacterized protein LOC127242755 isoform X2 [Andrographis paniculata]
MYVMHQKKSEAQIGTESSGISSDFNPTPPSSLTQKHPQFPQNYHPTVLHPPLQILIDGEANNNHNNNSGGGGREEEEDGFAAVNQYGGVRHRCGDNSPTRRFGVFYNASQKFLTDFPRRLRRLRAHLRLILLLSLPFLYFFVSHPSSSFLLDFMSAFAFSAALLFSLNLAVPRLPTIRLLLAKSLPIKIAAKTGNGINHRRPQFPVLWSIGPWQKAADKKAVTITGYYVQAYRNGDVYEGEFHKGKYNGSGVYYYYMSGRYEGDWVDGKYDGYGVETWARGSRYRGQYGQGLRHGFGVYRFYTGDVYAGQWSNGQSHGCGIHTCEDGSRYIGEFRWGVKHGLGHYHFRNGDRYAGEYFADKMHGFGVYYFANGHRYEGAWHEGKRQGLGMYSFRSGEAQSGHWQNGVLDVPSTQSHSYPVSPVAVNHSRVLNAVQKPKTIRKLVR